MLNGQQRLYRGFVVERPGGMIELHSFNTDRNLAIDTFCRDEAQRLKEGGVRRWEWYEVHGFSVRLAELRT